MILADDFTGSCDVGGQFAKRGVSTVVRIGSRPFYCMSGVARVIVQDTESRNLSQELAFRRVREFAQHYSRSKFELAYKKIDSTLRGNVGTEIDALLDVLPNQTVVIAPTYPEYDRTVIDGNLLVAGKRLEETEYVEDFRRINSSKLTDIICSQSNNTVDNILLSTVRRGQRSIVNQIRQKMVKGVQILCIDAENRADLRNIAVACRTVHALPCGSAGLAEEIAADLFPPAQRRLVVALCASTNKATLNEIRRSARSSECAVVVANATLLVSDESSRQHEISRVQRLIEIGYSRSKYVIVTSALSKADVERVWHIRINQRRARADIVRGLAASVAPLLSTSFDCGTVLTGGEMAAAFLTQIGARGARVETELAPGIIAGKIEGGRLDGMNVVTKAGGFGLPGTLLKVMKYLSTEKVSNQISAPQ